jgi:putative exporter of polyketide antibiotics
VKRGYLRVKNKLIAAQIFVGIVALFGLLSMLIQYEFEVNNPDLALQDIVKSGFIFIGSLLLLIYLKLLEKK